MATEYIIKEQDGVFCFQKGRTQVKTPNKALVTTKSRELAEWIKSDLDANGKQWKALHNVRFLHYQYCDVSDMSISEEVVERTKEWVKEVLYEDPFWAFDEPIQMRHMAVNKYISFLPDMIVNMPFYRLKAFITWASMTGSILLPYHIIRNILHDDAMYTLDDMDEFVDQLIEYGYDMEVNYTSVVPWNFNYLKSSIETLVRYFSLQEV